MIPAEQDINLSGISHRYHSARSGSVLALEDVTHRFAGGRVHAVIGPTGCGKSTLLQIIRGLVTPTGGSVEFDPGPPPAMATVWQAFNLIPWRTVLDNVAFGLELAGVPRARRRERARELIALVGLSGFERHRPRQLSGGMRQRVGLARALTVDPSVLLLDEPFGALDAQTRLIMQEELAKLYESLGKTVLLVTHSIDEAILLSDEVVVMTARPGRILEVVPVDLPRPRGVELLRHPEFAALFEHLYGCLKTEVMRSMGGIGR
jgi:NitT/TauT family transport system ATP-binding protein